MYCMIELQCRMGFHHTESVTGAGMCLGQWAGMDGYNLGNKLRCRWCWTGAGQSQFLLCCFRAGGVRFGVGQRAAECYSWCKRWWKRQAHNPWHPHQKWLLINEMVQFTPGWQVNLAVRAQWMTAEWTAVGMLCQFVESDRQIVCRFREETKENKTEFLTKGEPFPMTGGKTNKQKRKSELKRS